jgi:hypothetical protein
MKKTHYLRIDHRKKILELVISGLQNSIDELYSQISEVEWYDGGWFAEEVEPILGLSYIAYQNYINSSVYDKFGTVANKNEYYKKGDRNINGKRTEIELIIALANYYKHRDDDRDLHRGTDAVLIDLDLDYKKIYPEELPIIEGTNILSDSWKLGDITTIVTDWRESLWINE